MRISEEESTVDGSLPQMSVTVANFENMAYRFAMDSDLTGRSVTIRLASTLSNSGDESKTTMKIRGCVFTEETGSFELGYPFDMDSDGPRRTYNRRDYPGIPINQRAFGIS